MNRKQRRAMKAIGAPLTIPVENKPHEEALKEEYYRACAEAGELQFKLKQFEAALQSVNLKISDINKRYAELSQAPKQEPADVVQPS
jgi:chromosome segregation ATPase